MNSTLSAFFYHRGELVSSHLGEWCISFLKPDVDDPHISSEIAYLNNDVDKIIITNNNKVSTEIEKYLSILKETSLYNNNKDRLYYSPESISFVIYPERDTYELCVFLLSAPRYAWEQNKVVAKVIHYYDLGYDADSSLVLGVVTSGVTLGAGHSMFPTEIPKHLCSKISELCEKLDDPNRSVNKLKTTYDYESRYNCLELFDTVKKLGVSMKYKELMKMERKDLLEYLGANKR